MNRSVYVMNIKQKNNSEACVGRWVSKPIYSGIKRIFDAVFSFVLLVFLFLPLLIIALAVKLDSAGPVFYKQERLGLFGEPFVMLKFRTMIPDAERDGPVWAKKEDPRRTRVGVILRRFHLDELPQLWNILVGDMSFVGPRPERPIFYKEFGKIVKGFEKRLVVKPGLTGLSQINGGYDLTPAEKWLYDMEYIHDRSILLDLKCLIWTVPVILTARGSR